VWRVGMCMSIALSSLAGWAAVLRADTILLHNGDRIEGRIIGGTANYVHIRRSNEVGGSYVDIVDRVNIASIQRDPPQAASRPTNRLPKSGTHAGMPDEEGASASRPAADSAAVAAPAELPPDIQRALIVAIAKWRAEDYVNAGNELSRLINSADAGQREAMSAMTLATTAKTLAELAADAHMRAAIATRRGSAIRLPYVTEYEKPSLLPMLEAAYEAALVDRSDKVEVKFETAAGARSERSEPQLAREQFAPAVRPAMASARPWYEAYAQTRPAAEGDRDDKVYAVVDWLDRPEEFDGSPRQARALAPHVHLASSLLNERIRLDPALRRNADLKQRLMAERHRLNRLSKTLAARMQKPAVRTPTPEQVEAAEQARREQYRAWMEQQQKEMAERIAEAQENAKKWQEEQEKAKQKSWFDWLKPAPKDAAGSSQP